MAIIFDSDSVIGIQDDAGSGPVSSGVSVDEVSGGATSSQVSQASEQIEEFAAEGGGLLAICYGEHIIAGHLVAHKFVIGTPNQSFILVALGDGQGNGGLHGEWNAASAVYYAGQSLSVSPDGSTAGYRFRPGTISTSITDPTQPVDAFLSGGIALNGTAYIAVKLPDAFANAEDRPDKLRGRYQTRRMFDYDNKGAVQAYGYFANPALIAADRIRVYYERKYRADLNVAVARFQKKIDWQKFRQWADYNGAAISWDNGTSTVVIPRFDTHLAITQEAGLADILDIICASCAATWQDDGEQIIFLPPTDRDPVHHFDEENIVGAPIVETRDLREQPNLLVYEFRDVDDTFLGKVSAEVKRQDLINQMGENKSVRALPNMRQSQAQRVGEYQARLECDNPQICTLVADESSIHVLPGDFVTVSHPVPNWEYQRCLVLSLALNTAENSPDTCEFVLQRIDGALYSDTAHSPRQEALTP